MTWRPGLTRRGWALLVGGVAWCVGAWLIGQRDLWWPGVFLIALPVASRLILLPHTLIDPGVQRRVEPATVSVGQPSRIRLSLLDRAGVGGAVQLRDRLPAALGTPDRVASHAGEVTYQLRPVRRGRYEIGPLERRCVDGLGLAVATTVVDSRAALVVTPPVVPLSNLSAASGVGLAPDTVLLRTGQGGADDVLIREYRHGDDVRRIHWRSTARTGELMVRREERARNPVVTVLLDNRTAAYRDDTERFEQAVSAAASLAVHLVADGFDVAVVAADGTVFSPARMAGTERQAAILEHLAEVELVARSSLSEALASCRRGSEGQLLIAVLGRVETADVTGLAEAAGHGQAGWALLIAPSEADRSLAERLTAAGWRCAAAGAGELAAAWQAFGRQGLR